MDNSESPQRLKRPFPQPKSARSVFASDPNFPNGDPESTKIEFVPIIAWGAIRIRGRIQGAAGAMKFQFVRPARQFDPDDGLKRALFYVVDQPAITNTAWVDNTEFSLDITASEHIGENWLKVTLDPAGACDIDFFDISGVNLGL